MVHMCTEYSVLVNVVNHGQHCFGKVQEPDDPSVRANPRGQSILRRDGMQYCMQAVHYVLITGE